MGLHPEAYEARLAWLEEWITRSPAPTGETVEALRRRFGVAENTALGYLRALEARGRLRWDPPLRRGDRGRWRLQGQLPRWDPKDPEEWSRYMTARRVLANLEVQLTAWKAGSSVSDAD